MKRLLPLLGLLVILSGCFGAGDFSAKLCGDYYIHCTSAHQIHVSPKFWSPDTPKIPPKVVELGHNDRFIIARQNHLKRRNAEGRIIRAIPIWNPIQEYIAIGSLM